jgi:hypothetical protein
MKINFRHSARKHIANAKDFAAMDDDKGLNAACLELRMAIEALTYENLQVYIAEVGSSAMEKWQPRRVIEELLLVDPKADKTSQLAVGVEKELGKPAEEMQFLGTDHRFSIKWANKAHNALGSYLHEPTIAQHKGQKLPNAVKMRQKIEEILSELEPVLNSSVWGANFGVFVSFDCECSFTIKRKEEYLEAGKELICGSCGRIFDYEHIDGNWVTYPATVSFDCPPKDCDKRHTIGMHEAKPEFRMRCDGCGTDLMIVSQLGVVTSPTSTDAS